MNFYPKDIQQSLKDYEILISRNQKINASRIINDIFKNALKNNETKIITKILNEKMIGNIKLNNAEINKYILKIEEKSQKKRLMFCSGPWLTGGMERVLSNLFRNLHDKYELFLITPYEENEGLIELPEYVTHIKLSQQYFHNSFDHIALTHALVLDIDVVIGFWNLCDEQLDFYKLCINSNIKTVAVNNEMYFYPYQYPFHYRLIQKRLDVFKNLDAVLWPTNFSAASYGLANKNSFWMPNPNTYKIQENTIINNKKIILCVGRFNDYVKRVDRIIKCYSLVSKKLPDTKLILVGKYNKEIPIKPGYSTTINDLLKKYQINEKNIKFIGEVDNVADYYSKASLLLLTSNSEGFGIVVNEAACFGVPSVCNSIPGLEDLVIDGENGFIIKQDDIKTIANRVIQILSDKQLREKLGKNAKKNAVKFDESIISRKWEYLIETLLENDSQVNIKAKINVMLAYKIKDYYEFSKVLFDEINKIITINLEEKKLLANNPNVLEYSFSNKAKNNIRRLHKSVKTKGIIKTGKTAVKIIYRKIK